MRFYEKIMALICLALIIASWHVRSEPIDRQVGEAMRQFISKTIDAQVQTMVSATSSPQPDGGSGPHAVRPMY